VQGGHGQELWGRGLSGLPWLPWLAVTKVIMVTTVFIVAPAVNNKYNYIHKKYVQFIS